MAKYYPKMARYPTGSVVQHRNHYIFVKTDDKKWEAQHRWMAAQKGDATGKTGELQPGEKVYHLDGRKDNNESKNLIRIQFDTTKYYLKKLSESRVLHIPKMVVRELARIK